MTAPVTLHGYWRSSAAYRVRIALNLKGVGYVQVSHDLRAGEQRDADYLAIAPHGLVPALEVEGRTLIESPAILEWIDGKWPEPPLLPRDADEVAVVRSMAALIAGKADIVSETVVLVSGGNIDPALHARLIA